MLQWSSNDPSPVLVAVFSDTAILPDPVYFPPEWYDEAII
jgi:hypothetical protein